MGGGRLELVCLQADGLLDCRVRGGKDQHPEPVGVGAIVVGVRHRQGQDLSLYVEGLAEQPGLFLAGRQGVPRWDSRNRYSFEGLIVAALPFAKEKLIEKAAAIEEKKKRLERKKPKLVVNNAEQ
jgi:hypothetical protein